MPSRCCEFVDSRRRRCPPDRASAVPYGQAGENAMRFPHLAHRLAAAPQASQHSATARDDFDFGGMVKSAAGSTPLAYSSPEAVQTTGAVADPQALADAILQLLSNPDQRDAMAQAGFERASTMFSWDRIAEDLLEQYQR